jgi:glycosyltransferase involved in cell wall biosynthesis
MSSEKHLLIISNRYPVGPDDTASPFVHDFRRALENIGIGVDIVTPFYKTMSENNDYLDDSVHRFRWSDGSRVISQLPLFRPSTFFKIRKFFKCGQLTGAELLKKNNYDAIIALWAAPSGYIAYKLSRRFNIPYAVWALGSDINRWAKLPLVGNIIMKVLKNAEALYADGYELAMKVQSLTGDRCDFLPSYHSVNIDVEKLKSLEGSKKYFISVGRIEKSKGVFDLLDAFRKYHESNPDWELYYIGTGRAANELKHMIQSYKLEGAVEFNGYLPREEINRLLVNAAAAVIPSHSDSLPLTFGEAMQAGVPVICSDVGDMPFFIDKYKVGCYFSVGDVETLTERLKAMADKNAEFSKNCSDVLRELDIANSARTVSRWLENLNLERAKTGFVNAIHY